LNARPSDAGRIRKPVCVGAGLVALDVVIRGASPSTAALHAGGSCGNVMAILAVMGWNAFPVSRLGADVAGETVMTDFLGCGVRTELLLREASDRTPVITHRILGGTPPRHVFEWLCPNCRAALPRYLPLREDHAVALADHLPQPAAFYFDRISRGTLFLARWARSLGALVVFEPSSTGRGHLLKPCLEVADVVKYSSERLTDICESTGVKVPPLEIQTLGDVGLRYRYGRTKSRSARWHRLPPVPAREARDTAGAGDWCSAALIAALGSKGRDKLLSADDGDVRDALQFGQVLAAFNCQHDGARGTMCTLGHRRTRKLIAGIRNGVPLADATITPLADVGRAVKRICPDCPR
jgi:sugar/nucleoside kinase (ribokinase family)